MKYAVMLSITTLALSFVPMGSARAASANPGLNPSCGLDIALAIDSAAGIDTFELDELKTSFKAFAASLLPGTASQIAIIDLDAQGTVLQSLTPDLSLVNAAIDALSNEQDVQATNWQDALAKAQSVFPGNASAPNLIILATDFNPYFTGNPGVLTTDAAALADAVVAADAAKTAGTRVVALGIGDEIALANLQAISGVSVNTGATSDVLTSVFQTLETDPQQLLADVSAYAGALLPTASGACPTTITINKVIDQDGNVATTADQTPGANWQFTLGTAQYLTDTAGTTGPITVQPGTYPITETAQTGFQPISSQCTGDQVASAVTIANGQNLTCIFYNQPLGKIIITKDVIPDDALTSFGFTAAYDADGFALSDGQSNDSGYIPSGTYSVSETENSAYTTVATCDDGSPISAISLAPGETVTCTFTNTGKDGGITIVKQTTPANSDASFSFDPSWSEDSFALKDGESHNTQLAPGIYVVAETDIPTGWTLASAICTNENGNEFPPDNIFLNPNGSVTCVFQNTFADQGGSDEGGSSEDPGDTSQRTTSVSSDSGGGGGSVVYNFANPDSGTSGNTSGGQVAGAQTAGNNTYLSEGIGGAGDYLTYTSPSLTPAVGGAENLPRTGASPIIPFILAIVMSIIIFSPGYLGFFPRKFT